MLEVMTRLLTPQNFFLMFVGMAAGTIIGAMPGLTATMGVAILLPLTFGMDSIAGMLMLLAVYCGGIYGGSITAILIRTPGTPASAATVLDGYPLARQGKAGDALEAALVTSTIGGLFSCAALIFFAPLLAGFALRFGPAEYTALALFGLSIIASITSNSVSKGLMMAAVGLLVTVIGIDPIEGVTRFTFGSFNLMSGIALVPAMLGAFAVSEVFEKTAAINHPIGDIVAVNRSTLRAKDFARYWKTILKSSCIGVFIGAVPGTGAAISSFLSYNEAKRSSKVPHTFGTGNIEGVVASETANNAVTGATLIPLLTLGIPGDSVTAILIGALMMQGITPGPHLFTRDAFWVYAIMIGLILINLIMYLEGKVFIRFFVNVTRLSPKLLIPLLMVLCVVGSFAVNNSIFDVFVMLTFGVVCYALQKLEFPMTPLVIALVLGPLAEDNMRQALILSRGSFAIFFSRPISLFFIFLSLLLMIMPAVRNFRDIRKGPHT